MGHEGWFNGRPPEILRPLGRHLFRACFPFAMTYSADQVRENQIRAVNACCAALGLCSGYLCASKPTVLSIADGVVLSIFLSICCTHFHCGQGGMETPTAVVASNYMLLPKPAFWFLIFGSIPSPVEKYVYHSQPSKVIRTKVTFKFGKHRCCPLAHSPPILDSMLMETHS